MYLTDHLPLLIRPPEAQGTVPPGDAVPLSVREQAILDVLTTRGASFFEAIHEACGGGYPAETVEALWDLVWRGLLTSDTLHPLRAFTRSDAGRATHRRDRIKTGAPKGNSIPAYGFRSRRVGIPSAQGRWSLVDSWRASVPSMTAWSAALAQQLLRRYGVLTRDVALAENIPGGFSTLYPALKTMEESGRIRRGMFVGGVGATQFAMPAALDLLRSLKDDPDVPDVGLLAATDPANPYGTILKWPDIDTSEPVGEPPESHPTPPALSRSVGASVLLVNGALAAYLRRRTSDIVVWLPAEEPDRGLVARAVARQLASAAMAARPGSSALITHINGRSADQHALAPFLETAGFARTPMGLHFRRRMKDTVEALSQGAA